MHSDQVITFARFMELCLYDPSEGYYTRGGTVFGPKGDFYTSPYTHSLFSRILGDALAFYLASIGEEHPLDLIELGSGEGRLSSGVLESLQKNHPGVFGRIRYRAHEVGNTCFPDQIRGVVFSNEFFDALPVHRVRFSSPELREIYVRGGASITEEEGQLSDPRILDYMRRGFSHWHEGCAYEVNLRMVEVLEDLGHRLKQGFVVTLDYGFESQEYEAMERRDGTLMCYRHHQAHSDPYTNMGRQDLTSHVNFQVFRETARYLGWINEPLMSQRSFLTKWGLEDRLLEEEAQGVLTPERLQDRLRLKTLLVPGGISDTIKVQVQEIRPR